MSKSLSSRRSGAAVSTHIHCVADPPSVRSVRMDGIDQRTSKGDIPGGHDFHGRVLSHLINE